MTDRFAIGEHLQCGDFVGRLGGRLELATGEVELYLVKRSFVKIGSSFYQVEDYRVANEKLCQKAEPGQAGFGTA